jgi:N-ethylmaleimide reductase
MLFDAYTLGALTLANRVVMAPMTRSRAVELNTPNALMAKFYAQRATAGLLITEGTSPSPNGLGYARIPGLYDDRHVAGWRLVTDAVHAKGGKIFVQLMHTGRVGAGPNLPAGAVVLGPSAETCPGTMYTDAKGMLPHDAPRPMTEADIARAVAEYGHSAALAVEAGFDGVELHGANGYLIEQFLNPLVNLRDDEYGGSSEGRNLFALEVARAAVAAIGPERVGIRLSPHGAFNGTGPYEGVDAQYLALASDLSSLRLGYVHLVNHSSMGAPPVPRTLEDGIRAAFKGTLILSGGYDRDRAEADLVAGRGDLVAFARPFISNPDLVRRLQEGAALAPPNPATFYTPGAAGYTDYPAL